MLHVISRGPITPLDRGYNHRFVLFQSPCEAPRLKMGFLWDPILGKLNWEANLERGRSRSLLKVSSCRQENRVWSGGVNVLTRQLRFVCWETFWGLVSWKWKKNPSFFDSQLKNDGSSWISKVGQVGQQAYVWFQLFSIFLMFFLGNSIGWFNHHLEMISISRSIHQEFQFCWAYTRSIFSYIFPKYKLTSNKSCFPNHCRMCPGVRVVLWSEGISNLLYIYPKNTNPPENKFPLISL